MSKLSKKVANDLYATQMKWVAWFLPIVFIVYVAMFALLNEPEMRSMSLLTFTFQATNIFMLVCGILSVLAFLPTFVKQGVTRKAYL